MILKLSACPGSLNTTFSFERAVTVLSVSFFPYADMKRPSRPVANWTDFFCLDDLHVVGHLDLVRNQMANKTNNKKIIKVKGGQKTNIKLVTHMKTNNEKIVKAVDGQPSRGKNG